MGADQVVTLFKYKQWIDAETLQAIKRVDPRFMPINTILCSGS